MKKLVNIRATLLPPYFYLTKIFSFTNVNLRELFFGLNPTGGRLELGRRPNCPPLRRFDWPQARRRGDEKHTAISTFGTNRKQARRNKHESDAVTRRPSEEKQDKHLLSGIKRNRRQSTFLEMAAKAKRTCVRILSGCSARSRCAGRAELAAFPKKETQMDQAEARLRSKRRSFLKKGISAVGAATMPTGRR
jgi:hypothetical protein